MMRLVRSEWERLWAKKVTWLCFAGIPVMLFASAKYYIGHNQAIAKTAVDYTYSNTFPVMGLAEMLISAFNLILLVTMALMISHEYHSGQMRMVLQRAHTYRQILLGKMITMFLMMALFFLVYFTCSYVIGYLCFNFNPNIFLFYYEQPTSSGMEVFLYTLKYYGVAYVMMVCVISIFMMLTVLSKSTTSAIAFGIGFIILSLGVPEIMQHFVPTRQVVFVRYSSIVNLQYEGIALSLIGKGNFIYLCLGVLSVYIAISNFITFYVVGKKDHFV
ncbi:ABC transporter permease [Bacillus pseudomycoides]|uniref:ABC transporter permease n=1 Tax=Bacillus pseudomycoides TaxID=64104 RepID=UPI000BECAB22|nr:ABC transporter permease subunit [Bacillus pseudomycoides]PEE40376.1 ABC transporter permease [Bacillus pseudomycoides]PEI90297.1 ABC transporter permease [Bacillus pseudomycoides]PGA87077.1 ABC transporter permease [Bacillus pseudomycoides]PHF45000.1 ABC transporter permease [Bacillus pseudomycoides]